MIGLVRATAPGLALLLAAAVAAAQTSAPDPKVAALRAEAEALRYRAQTHQQLEEFDTARSTFARALAIYVELGDRGASGQLRDDLGLLAWTIGDANGVRRYYTAAADDYAAAGRIDRQAYSLRGLAFAADVGPDEGIAILERAVVLADAAPDRNVQGLVRHALGDKLILGGDHDRAIKMLESAAAILETAGTAREFASALSSLGRAYRLQGEPDQAITVYSRALAIRESIQDKRAMAQTYDAIAVTHASAGRRAESRAAYERAMETARDAGLKDALALYVVNLTSSMNASQEYERAAALLAPLRGSEQPGVDRMVRHNLAFAYRGLGRLAEARREIDVAVDGNRTANDRTQLALSLWTRALIRRDVKDLAGALDDVSQAIAQAEGPAAAELRRQLLELERELRRNLEQL